MHLGRRKFDRPSLRCSVTSPSNTKLAFPFPGRIKSSGAPSLACDSVSQIGHQFNETSAVVGEIDKTAVWIGGDKLDVDLLADLEAIFPTDDHSVDGRSKDAGKGTLVGNAGDDRIKCSPTLLHYNGARPFGFFARPCGGFFLIVAMSGNRVEFLGRVGGRLVCDNSLYQPLNYDVGETPVWRGRMRGGPQVRSARRRLRPDAGRRTRRCR